MRIRASVAVVSGALAATALAAPAAHAEETPFKLRTGPVTATKGYAAAGKEYGQGDTRVSKVGFTSKPLVVGVSEVKKVQVTFTAKDNSGIVGATAMLWRGSHIDHPEDWYNLDEGATCSGSGTTVTCKGTITFNPEEMWDNSDAGDWKLAVGAGAYDEDFHTLAEAKSFRLQRAGKLSVNASPEPVTKGQTLTVTGQLTRANWLSQKYWGYAGQSVKLQYRAKNATSYTTLKTVKSNSEGKLSTTVKATADGYYRYTFAGTTTTQAATAAGDYVDVR
ncbi:hypothetical protein ABT354_15685 [Streptomyces sp. NPDC000594]|uniref:hypothetical protein n=1 Tax=Streptomyces sp. NPDC000594 TaxID=3154261 RepID=UPI00332F7150